jgi:hypothetical protein
MSETIIEKPEVAAAHAAQRNEASYPNFISGVQNNFGIVKVPIYLYNISRIEFNTPRPPNHPHMLIRACPEGQEYLLVGQITHPFDEVDYDQNNNKKVVMTDGYIEATRMLNPLNPGIDQEFDAPNGLSEGGNLNQYGCFWSVHNPPYQGELDAARKRMEKTYTKALEKMAAVEAKSPEDARGLANNIHHAAADYFGLSFSWHRTDLIPKNGAKPKVDCGACGEKINSTARICSSCGAPTDPQKLEQWLESKFEVKRGPGRPANA